jgi:hypothetical protein
MTFSRGDRVRFRPDVTAAFGPPDRRGKVATVAAAWSDGGLERLDVLFDDETTVKKGYAAVQFEPLESER